MFESRISAGETEKNYHIRKIFVFLRGPTTWKAMPRNVWNDYCELANRTTQQLYKVSTPCIDDLHFQEEELKSVGLIVKSVLSNCSEMLVLGFDILWSVNKTCTIDYEMDQSL